jgi:hypothetical protein
MAVYAIDARPGEVINLENLIEPEPFELRMGLGSASWQDPVFSKVLGKNFTLASTLGAFWHHEAWSLGLVHQPPSEAKGTLRPGLKSSFKTELTQIMGSYSFKLAGDFALQPLLGVGQQPMSITLQDEFGQSLSFKQRSIVLNAQIRLSWRRQDKLALSIWQQFSESSWDYDRIGNLSGRRWETGIDMGWHFGGRVRRLQ